MARACLIGGVASLALLMVLPGCRSSAVAPHRDLEKVWRDYRGLPDERALAIAGNPADGPWVTAASAGHATQEDAKVSALAECRRKRGQRRMQNACVLYAVGDDVVWRRR